MKNLTLGKKKLYKILFATILASNITDLPAAIAAPNCIKSLTVTRSAMPLRISEDSSAFFDFDGDSISDILTVEEKNNSTVFTVVNSSNAETSETILPSGKAVPADYDGDGKWDYAVARRESRGINWLIVLSSNNQRVSRILGKAGSSLISGCRFLSSGKHSLAAYEGRKLQAVEIGSRSKRNINFSELSRANPVGCGDATGDGIDELLIGTPDSSGLSEEVSSVSCSNDNVDYGARGNGRNLFVINSGNGEIPLIGFQRLRSNKEILLRFNQLYDSKKNPHFYLPADSEFTFGNFLSSTGASVLGIIWKTTGSNSLIRQLFSKPAIREQLSSVANNRKLIKPQRIIDNSDLN